MSHRVAVLTVACALFLRWPLAAHAAPIEGLWLIQEKNAHILIESYQGELCGRIAWTRDSLDTQGKLRRDTKNPDPALRDRLVRGLIIVSGLSPESPDSTRWKGRVYDPRNGKTYAAKLALESAERLKLRGYVLGIPLLGRSTHWTRVPKSP